MRIIQTLAKPLMLLKQELERIVAFYVNKKKCKRGEISPIEYDLKNILLKKRCELSNTFYQSYPPLKIGGRRGTICRSKTYEVEKFLNKKMEVLDIGGNLGFFSAFISKQVKSIDVVEKIEPFVEIARKLIQFEKIENVRLYCEDFKNFKKLHPDKKYDLIISCAVHDLKGKNKSRVEMNLQDYLDSLIPLLKKGGLVLFESHGIFYKTGEQDIEKRIKLNRNFSILQEGFTDDFGGMTRQFFWLKNKNN